MENTKSGGVLCNSCCLYSSEMGGEEQQSSRGQEPDEAPVRESFVSIQLMKHHHCLGVCPWF